MTKRGGSSPDECVAGRDLPGIAILRLTKYFVQCEIAAQFVHDLILPLIHEAAVGGGVVVEAGEMKDAVDDVQDDFVPEGTGFCAGRGYIDADTDFTDLAAVVISIVERNDVCGALVAEVRLIQAGDRCEVDEHDGELIFPIRFLGQFA